MIRIATLFMLLLAFSAGAQHTSLSHSVNQAKSQGKVLSAKTKNGEHVVKVLTPDGRIKTITQPVSSQRSSVNSEFRKKQSAGNQRDNPFQKNKKGRSKENLRDYSKSPKSNRFPRNESRRRDDGSQDRRPNDRKKNNRER